MTRRGLVNERSHTPRSCSGTGPRSGKTWSRQVREDLTPELIIVGVLKSDQIRLNLRPGPDFPKVSPTPLKSYKIHPDDV